MGKKSKKQVVKQSAESGPKSTHVLPEKNPTHDATFEILDDVDFFESIKKLEQYENRNNKGWKKLEMNDVERVAYEGVTDLDILDASEGDAYDAFVNSLIGRKQAVDNEGEEDKSTDVEMMDTSEDNKPQQQREQKKKAKPAKKQEEEKEEKQQQQQPQQEESKKKKKQKNKKRKRDEMEKEDSKESEEKEQPKELKPMTAWSNMGIETGVLQCIQKLEFTEPTPIQKQSIPLAMNNSDILAAAETGSGKTLAFGVPIVSNLMKQRIKNFDKPEETAEKKQGLLQALILAPTRELAAQVSNHVRNILPYNEGKYTEHVRIINIFGGMSEAKQHRQMSSRPHIIVATPGRFWDFIKRGFDYLTELQELKYLVIDEADRMFANGHFPELTNILAYIDDRRSTYEKRNNVTLPKIQKFVSSATLTLEPDENGSRKVAANAQLTQLLDLMQMDEYELVDVLRKDSKLSGTLFEAQIQCGDEEDKLINLYYFLQFYPGRTLIFTNTIKKARVVHAMFRGVLGLQNVNILHGEMQQRARLKNLDRFSGSLGKQGDNTVLIATDVAARGLDIPDVKHVIHFQLPAQTDVYIHRCGRTGRAQKEGISVALVSVEDKKVYQTLMSKLHSPAQDLPLFPLSNHYYTTIPHLRSRIKLALKLELKNRKSKIVKNDKTWFKQNADELGIELDDTFFPGMQDSDEEIDDGVDSEAVELRRQLDKLLATPLPVRLDKQALARSFVTSDESIFEQVTDTTTTAPTALGDLKADKKKGEDIKTAKEEKQAAAAVASEANKNKNNSDNSTGTDGSKKKKKNKRRRTK